MKDSTDDNVARNKIKNVHNIFVRIGEWKRSLGTTRK